MYGLSWWLGGKESAYQCRRCGFDPWVGKISLEKEIATQYSCPHNIKFTIFISFKYIVEEKLL